MCIAPKLLSFKPEKEISVVFHCGLSSWQPANEQTLKIAISQWGQPTHRGKHISKGLFGTMSTSSFVSDRQSALNVLVLLEN
jgi:hypothetical protein